MIAQARLSAIEERKPNPREKSKDLEQRARAILSHTPAPAAQDSASLSALLLPPQAAAYDGAAFTAAGCDPATMKTAGIDDVVDDDVWRRRARAGDNFNLFD